MQNTKRLFIGLSTNNTVIPQVYQQIREEFANSLYGKWVELQNLHITLKFLGDTDSSLIPEMLSALDGILGSHSGTIVSRGLDAFPSLNRPRVLFIANSAGSEFITEMADKVEAALAPFNFENDGKPFRPHLTICRIKELNQRNFSAALEQFRNYDFGVSENFSVNLFESRLTPHGPIYKIIH